MRIPFQDELEDIFRNDRSVWSKIGASALAAMFFGAYITIARKPAEITAAWSAALVVGITVLGGLVGLALSIKDTVKRRGEAGKPVNWLLRIYFGMGIPSFVVWTFTIFGAAFLYVFILTL